MIREEKQAVVNKCLSVNRQSLIVYQWSRSIMYSYDDSSSPSSNTNSKKVEG
jgi:hypothetical protein